MPRLPDGFVDEVRSSANVVNVISGFMSLKKVGRSHKGLCPFHSEKTPSFTVNEDRGVYHCFGCGAGGDVFRFVMEHDRLDFIDAVVRVAELSGIAIPDLKESAGDDRRQRLLQVNEAALRVYRQELEKASGSAARSYLEKRGIGAEAIATFEIGVTGEGWESLARALLKQGIAQVDIIAAGLAKERPTGGGIYDRFHQRLIFPIRDVSGRVVGFGGRALDGHEPKYLNSPETEVYRKSDVLYGFNLAREEIRRSGRGVLVEGYLDVIAVHQAGIKEVVASLGTSLTDGHAKLLKRFTKRVLIAYDGDAAGQKATMRGLSVLLPHQLEVGVVTLPEGQDPDDLVKAKGADSLRDLIGSARGFVPFVVDRVQAQRGDSRTPEGAAQVVNEVLPLLVLLDDPIERATQVALLAERVGIDNTAVMEALRRAARDRKDHVEVKHAVAPARVANVDEEVLLMAILMASDGASLLGEMESLDWKELATASLFEVVQGRLERGEEIAIEQVVAGIDDVQGRDLMSAIALRHGEMTLDEGRSALRSIRHRRIQSELSALQRQIAQSSGDELDVLFMRKLELSRILDLLA